MNSNLQTTAADILVEIEPWGNELWFLLGVALIFLLSLLAFTRQYRVHERFPGRLAAFFDRLNSDSVFIGLCIFTILLLRLPGVSRLELAYGDEGGLIAGALTLLQDPRFWLSVDNTTIGPVSTFSLTLIDLVGGTINYGTIKLLGILVWMLSAFLLFRALVNLYGSQLARLAVLPLVACVATFNVWDYVAFNGEHIPVLLLALSVWLFSRLERTEGLSAVMFAVLTGFVLGLIPFSKVQAGPIAVAFGVMLVLYSWFRGNRHALALILGGLLPPLFIIVYLLLSGAFEDFWQSYILNNLVYASEGFFGQKKDFTVLENALGFPAYLLRLPDTRYYFISQFVIIIAGSLVLLTKWRSSDRQTAVVVPIAWVVVLASIYCILLPKNNWTHYLLLLLVPLTLLYGGVLGGLKNLASKRQQALPGAAGMVIVAALLLVSVLLPSLYVLLNKNIAFEAAMQNSFEGRYYSDVAKEIFKYAERGERIAVWGFAYYYEETGMAQGTREAHTERQMTPGTQQPYYLDRWMRDLERIRPPILLESFPKQHLDQQLIYYPEVKELVDASYRKTADIDGVKVYVRKERLQAVGVAP